MTCDVARRQQSCFIRSHDAHLIVGAVYDRALFHRMDKPLPEEKRAVRDRAYSSELRIISECVLGCFSGDLGTNMGAYESRYARVSSGRFWRTNARAE